MYVPEKQRSMELLPLPVSAKAELAKAAASATAVSWTEEYSFLEESCRSQRLSCIPQNQRNSDWERIAEVKSNVSSYQDSQDPGNYVLYVFCACIP